MAARGLNKQTYINYTNYNTKKKKKHRNIYCNVIDKEKADLGDRIGDQNPRSEFFKQFETVP